MLDSHGEPDGEGMGSLLLLLLIVDFGLVLANLWHNSKIPLNSIAGHLYPAATDPCWTSADPTEYACGPLTLSKTDGQFSLKINGRVVEDRADEALLVYQKAIEASLRTRSIENFYPKAP